MSSINALIRKHWQLITFIVSLLLFVWLIWKLIGVVLPFIVGLFIAYLLLPVVRWLEKHLPGGKKHPGLKRISIIIGIYFIALVAIGGIVFYVFTVVTGSASLLWQNLPQLISGIVARVQGFLAKVRLDVPASLLRQYDQAIANSGAALIITVTVIELLKYFWLCARPKQTL